MNDLHARFKSFDEMRAPDLWLEIQERAAVVNAPAGIRGFPTTNRFASMALLAVVVLILIGLGLLLRPPHVGPELPAPSASPTAISSELISQSPGPATDFLLPTLNEWDGNCDGIDLNAELMGDPDDPRVAWVVDTVRGRLEIVFPPGFSARFTPDLVVLDDEGSTVGVEGDHVRDGCVTGLEDGVLLIPELAIRR
jgi:hypothetical protein